MAGREITPTHSAFLELREERAGMQEGYGFLDEKRLILAAEILSELARYEQAREGFHQAYTKAAAILRTALARHGLEGLEIYPKAAVPCRELHVESRSVLGVRVQAAAWETGERETPPRTVGTSPEADECRDSFVDLVLHAASLAVLAGNLERLRLEYSRTARRARALEDVLLPEIDESLRLVEGALEEMEREEAMRVRQVRSVI
jgi:V/A-type H+-transporting ATPase subunit D